jgi:hypothetical protein
MGEGNGMKYCATGMQGNKFLLITSFYQKFSFLYKKIIEIFILLLKNKFILTLKNHIKI